MEVEERRSYHIEGRPGGYDGIFVFDVFDACPWETDRDDGEETQYFAYKSRDVGYFFLNQTLLPCVAIWVDFHDLFVGTLLDFLTVG